MVDCLRHGLGGFGTIFSHESFKKHKLLVSKETKQLTETRNFQTSGKDNVEYELLRLMSYPLQIAFPHRESRRHLDASLGMALY